MALIGVRSVGNTDFLAVKLSRRKNLDGGCILKRTCMRDTGASVGARICPLAEFGPSSAPELGRANCYSHGILRTTSTAPLEVIIASWAWLGSGFRSYLDFAFNRPRKISRTPIALGDSYPGNENRTPQPKAVRK